MPNYINSVNLRENSDFPYLVLDVVDRHPTPRNPGFHVFHWHHDLQLLYVLVGRVRVQTLAETLTTTERSILPFLNDQDWTKKVNGLLRGLNELKQSKGAPLYPYQVLTTLAQLWLVIEEHLLTKKLVKPTIA